MKKYLVISILLLTSSCATTPLSPEAKKLVILKTAKPIEGICAKVGIVNASSGMTPDPVFTMIGNGESVTKMKNLAARMGNVLVITKNEESILMGSTREGDVYRCPANVKFVPPENKSNKYYFED